MTNSEQIGVTVPEPLHNRLEKASQKTGLSKSEIARRGLLDQVNELEGGSE